jgi:hypothetical protein
MAYIIQIMPIPYSIDNMEYITIPSTIDACVIYYTTRPYDHTTTQPYNHYK